MSSKNWVYRAAKGSLACLVLGVPAYRVSAAPFALTSVGVYDAATNANTVDSTASGSAATVSAFAADVLIAYNANTGGVIDFDIGGTITQNNTEFDLRYGASATKNLRLNTNVTIGVVPNVNPSTGTVSAISGAGVLTNQTSGDGDITFSFGDLTSVATSNILPDERVTALGFTMLARNNYGTAGRTFTVTANFSNSTTAQVVTNISDSKGADDTFLSFAAPASAYITSIVVNSDQAAGNSNTPAFDDFAFRTSIVPEPASASVLGLVAAALLGRRRRGFRSAV